MRSIGKDSNILQHAGSGRPSSACRSFREGESGQALVVMVLCITFLVAFLGLAIDVGLLYHARQNEQIAADAAATAAALDFLYNRSVSSAQAAGQAAATANGYTDGSGGVSVVVNVPPKSGPDQVAGYAEAIVKAPNLTSFMAVLGMSSVTVGVRAVAGNPTLGDACIYLMAPTGTDLTMQGSYNIQAPNCGIYVNSKDSDSIAVTGGGNSGSNGQGTVNAAYLDAVGSSIGQGTKPTPVTPDSSPQKSIYGDNISSPSCSYTYSANGNQTIDITSSNQSSYSASATYPVVCFANPVKLETGVALPGLLGGAVYEFPQGLTIATNANVSFGSCSLPASGGGGACPTTVPSGTLPNYNGDTIYGAVIDVDTGTFNQNSNAVFSVYAPNTGAYNGIAIMQPLANATELQVQFGSNGQVIDGYIYAPGAEVYLQDSGGGVTASGIVANTMFVKTGQLTIDNYDQANSETTINHKITLVE